MVYLVVVRPFGPYRIGDIVDDVLDVEHILASEHGGCVVRVNPPSEG